MSFRRTCVAASCLPANRSAAGTDRERASHRHAKILHSGLSARRRTLRLLSSCGDRLALKESEDLPTGVDRFVILRMRVAIPADGALQDGINGPRCATSGLPLFSRSSSKPLGRKDGCTSPRQLFLLANDNAEFSSRKIPADPALDVTDNPEAFLLRPMKNAGSPH